MTSTPDTDPGSVARRSRELRPQVQRMVDRLLGSVAERVERYAKPSPESLSLLAEAATAAVHRFLDEMDGAPHRERNVDELFRAVGRREALAGRSLVDFHAAISVASRMAWNLLQGDDEASAAVPPALADALFAFSDHLAGLTESGYEDGLRQRADDPQVARRALAERLLTGQPRAAKGDVWTVPTTSIVAVAPLGGHRPDLGDIARTSLLVGRGDSVVVIAAESEAAELGQRLADAGAERVAVSWGVERVGIPAAYGWARSALRLAERGVIPPERVIDCKVHRTQIWLHSEPYLRQQLTQELLRPLLAETPNSREILSETLLVWLETRDSAPAIAGKLNVHPQTVRYRWKRINELFGDSLHDPDFMVQVTMLLKASVPLWKAGDQSDFERFREVSG